MYRDEYLSVRGMSPSLLEEITTAIVGVACHVPCVCYSWLVPALLSWWVLFVVGCNNFVRCELRF